MKDCYPTTHTHTHNHIYIYVCVCVFGLVGRVFTNGLGDLMP